MSLTNIFLYLSLYTFCINDMLFFDGVQLVVEVHVDVVEEGCILSEIRHTEGGVEVCLMFVGCGVPWEIE